MHFSGAILPLSLLASAASAAHFDVTVGKGGQLKFNPETIDAHKGDTITYNFFAKNHSVIQSSFDKPCVPIPGGGIFSGFVPTADPDVASRTTFTIEVKDETPIWIYCGQTVGNHCQNGMVHAINAPKTGNTFDAFKQLAAKAPPPSISPPGGPTGGVRKTTVDVGLNGTLTYTPNDIVEIPGTIVEFKFNPKNHTVTQSSFAKPCFPLSDSSFSSGFVSTSQSDVASFFIEIKDTTPIWFYCGQVNGNHCQMGMAGGINAPRTGNTVAAFIELAKKAPPPSVIPPKAPIGGLLVVKDIVIKKDNLNGGNAIDVDAILASGSAGNYGGYGSGSGSYGSGSGSWGSGSGSYGGSGSGSYGGSGSGSGYDSKPSGWTTMTRATYAAAPTYAPTYKYSTSSTSTYVAAPTYAPAKQYSTSTATYYGGAPTGQPSWGYGSGSGSGSGSSSYGSGSGY